MTDETDDNPTPNGEHRIIVAGFGGQGILTLGKLLCMSAIGKGRTVTYLPSYGSEVRGGTANCQVVISSELIYSPLVERADSLIILNQPSFERFANRLRAGGLLIVNSSAVGNAQVPGAEVLTFPATDMAVEMGNIRVANVMMLGAFVKATGLLDDDCCRGALKELLGSRKAELLDINLRAFRRGAELAAAGARTA